MAINGFPVLQQLNHMRTGTFNNSHDFNKPASQRIPNFTKAMFWLSHKAFTLTTFPANLAGLGLGAAGLIISASTLGTLKVAIFAVTLGNIKPSFPTGCCWFGERAIHSGVHLGINIYELGYDTISAAEQGVRCIKWVGDKLHITNYVKAIFKQLNRLFEFMARRVNAGFNKAMQDEKPTVFSLETPSPIRPLNDLTNETRINWKNEQRPFKQILKHTFFSVANIPVNSVTAVCAAIASLILSTAFIGKVMLYAVTENIKIPVPTYAAQAMRITAATTANAALDTGVDIADGFITIYKVSEALGIKKAAETCLRVVAFIPEALFG